MSFAITGANFTGFATSARGRDFFQAQAMGKKDLLPGTFYYATEEEITQAVSLASNAFALYRKTSFESRAVFLEAIAEEIMATGDVLIERCTTETALPAARITGERARTCNQLKMFAQLLRDGWWVDARIDTAQPQRQPLPKPGVRRMLVPLGPVAVFGASNFPLAFSTAGGDTASALAAGCPVIVKTHSSHPGTNELVSAAIIRAAQKTGMPDGVFSSLNLSHANAIRLVTEPTIKAVGFTGSRSVGMRLFHAAVSRPEPIPVYAEMSAVNPVVLLEGALVKGADNIAKQLAASVTLGVGQFCTNPGLILMVNSAATSGFLTAFASEISKTIPGTMLNKNVYNAFTKAISERQSVEGINQLGKSSQEPLAEKCEAHPVVHTITADMFLASGKLSDEIFGPASLLVLCESVTQLLTILQSLEGQLTATIHAGDSDAKHLPVITDIVTQKAGRIIFGGYPTGVEVCHSMQHGGPFPSTTDGRSTSVGTAAIYRFVRPVAYQDFPDHLLPEALQDQNPLNILRLVDSEWTTKKI
jgi:2,5-dioxopentanoate dehydrogenase